MGIARRRFLQAGTALAGAAITCSLPAFAQYATLQSVAYLSRRLDVTPADFRTWYIQHHAVDFLSFARPHLVRYTQDYVARVHMGEANFDVISQFGWRSAEDRDRTLKFMASPEGKAVMAKHPRIGARPGPHEDHSGARSYSIEERLIAGPARGYDSPATKKQAALLRRIDNTPTAFATAVNNYAGNVFRKSKGATLRVTVNFAVPESGRPTPFHDAIVMVWPRDGVNLAGIMKVPEPGIEIAHILDLDSYDTDLS